jgi:hypothetical protein
VPRLSVEGILEGNAMRNVTAFLLSFLLVVVAMIAQASAARDVDLRHHVEVFTTSARQSADGTRWLVPVHVWIYTPQRSRVRKAAMATVLKQKYGLLESITTEANFDRRANLLFADNHRGRRLTVKIAGRVFDLQPTLPNGHSRSDLDIPASDISTHIRDGQLSIEVVLPQGDTRLFRGQALIVAPEGLSVISDIDDTVKISNVTDHAKLMDGTFFKDFSAVPGMAPLYASWAQQGMAIHFVSSSPWHLYAPLNEMFNAAGFPTRTLDLKQIRLKDSSILDLFRDASKTKPPAIEALLAAYPRRHFVLVGDSGELDPEVYAGIVRKNPGRIAQVLIRNVTQARSDDARFTKAFTGLPADLWQLFDDPQQIRWQQR